MEIHKNARLTPILREELARKVLLEGMTLKAAAAAFNVSPDGSLCRTGGSLLPPASVRPPYQFRIGASHRVFAPRTLDLDPTTAPAVVRYEHAAPGDLLHLDIKELGRFGCVGHRIPADRHNMSPGVGNTCTLPLMRVAGDRGLHKPTAHNSLQATLRIGHQT